MTDQPKPPASAADGSDDDAPDDAPDDDDGLSVSALEPERATLRRFQGARARRELRRVWRASGAMALIALAAIVVVAVAPHLPRPAQSRVQIPYTALSASNDVASCLTGASWSADGKRIAVVDSDPCGSPYLGPGATPPNLLIFDATTGRQAAAYRLDPAVNAALARTGVPLNPNMNYDISYYETNWSPDGQHVAISFGVYGELIAESGVAVVTLAGAQRSHIAVSLNAPDASTAMPNNGFDLIPAVRWDLLNSSHTTIYLSPALAYRWLPGDVLVAAASLPSDARAPAPSEPAAVGGAPIGGQSFSMWRTGTIEPVTATACGATGVDVQPLSAPYALLTLNATIWSPDGRYLLDAFVQARLPAAAGHPAPATGGFSPCDSGLAPDQLPTAPFHDNGLRAALRLLDVQGDNQLQLAWSSDGRRLAVTTLTLAQTIGALVVYDCATGATLQRFTGDEFEADVAQYGLAQNPVWSPDGRYLLLTISRPAPKVVILGPQALGA